MYKPELIDIINLLNVPLLGPQRIRSLSNHFTSLHYVFKASRVTLCRCAGIDINIADRITQYKDFDFGKKELERAEKNNVTITSFWDESYPILLKKIYDAPLLLYSKGQPLHSEEDAVAIVGTRKFTPYGKSMTLAITHDLNIAGIVVVSGLARGIDTIAHKETVKNNSRTIAILGSGIDNIYPSENKRLADEICEKGTIVTEFRFGTKPNAGNFPQRNRIISGLTHGTVVVEAGFKSGALLTALSALDQNREVFAVPGRVTDPQSQGTNRLIRHGAFPLERASQILEQIQTKLFKLRLPVQEKINLDLSNEERNLFQFIDQQPKHIDDIVDQSGISLTYALTLLLTMEMKGAVLQLSGKQFVRA